ncbi:hypothetical protein CRUP_011040 [Coryphaenoides rupestris]|nr:hypothetical protein CRUP_011040 [Coryphaenoides rupestris]
MMVPVGLELSPAPQGLDQEYGALFTSASLSFLHQLVSQFNDEVDQVLRLRVSRKAQLDASGALPDFSKATRHVRDDPAWRVLPVPPRLQRRHVDVGDMAPCDTPRLLRALQSPAQGLQVDGREVPGPLFDFGLLMFHCGKALYNSKSGPFFYLSKLGLPRGSIKATVLIENVLATFEMDEILYELREHSAGLNCGIWDYSASFVNKFGHREAFLLPDRSKYVNMEKRFLRSYMDLLVQTCHRRGALATGGMAAPILPPDRHSHAYRTVLANVTRLKLLEIKAGVDGFMVYDLNLIEPMQELFQQHTAGDNQLQQVRDDVTVTPEDLVCMPAGGVTLYGLKYNIGVGILFIHAWLSGNGHFFYRGQVEDSATAEISRSQVWQWICHQAQLEDNQQVVTRAMVVELTQEVMEELRQVTACQTVRDEERLQAAAEMFLEVVLKRDFPEFLTTYLNLDHTFLSSQAKRDNVARGALTSKL